MDNITHSLIGFTIAKSLDSRPSPYVTTTCILAANAPDIDIIVAFTNGSWSYLHHHRGITHSIVGTIALAFITPLLISLIYYLWNRYRQKEPAIGFNKLLTASLLASTSHPMMDWTNNYGVRPLLPWDSTWYYGDLLYIIDPWVWLSLGGAAFLIARSKRWKNVVWSFVASVITIFLLVVYIRGKAQLSIFIPLFWILGITILVFIKQNYSIDNHRRTIMIGSLAIVVSYLMVLSVIHNFALTKAGNIANQLSSPKNERIEKLAIFPSFASATKWRGMAETDRATYRFDFSLLASSNSIENSSTFLRIQKPVGKESEWVKEASKDWRAKILLNFSRFPVAVIKSDPIEGLVVQFADLRYTEPNKGGRVSLEIKIKEAGSGM
jgi:inner membrane protein